MTRTERSKQDYLKNRSLRNQQQRERYQKDRLKHLVNAAHDRARKKGIKFDLDHTKLEIPKICPVLGVKISTKVPGGKNNRLDNGPSLHRINPKKGYVHGNVIIISWRANRLIADGSLKEFLQIVDFYMKNGYK